MALTPTPVTSSPNVSYIRDEVKALIPQWETIRDCIAGEAAIKARGDKYLPRPSSCAASIPEGAANYNAYIGRAVFYNVTKRTLGGLVGQIFLRDPVIEIPASLEALKVDATGSGVDLEQLAKQTCDLNISYGRSGLLTDYPKTNGPVSQADAERGNLKPTINCYDPWDIINWRTITRGSKTIPSLVVLRETYSIEDDGYESKMAYQWRVLRLVNDVYTVEIWKSPSALQSPKTYGLPIMLPDAVAGYVRDGEPFTPLDAKGNTLDEIPFTFIGSEDNEPTPSSPPLYDLAALNIAHYRNSADFEESCFVVGQPTVWVSGLTKEWIDNVFKGKVPFGSKAVVPLPREAAAGVVQVTENTMAKEAMEQKERQMVALGAKLVEQAQVQRTATEAGLENVSEISSLAAGAKNVSAAFVFALKKALLFAGGDEESTEIKFELNTEFDLIQLSPAERQQLVSEWQAGALTFTEMRENMRRGGVARLDDNEARLEIGRDQAAEFARMETEQNILNPPDDPNKKEGEIDPEDDKTKPPSNKTKRKPAPSGA